MFVQILTCDVLTTALANKEDNKEAKSLVLDARLVPKTKVSEFSCSYGVTFTFQWTVLTTEPSRWQYRF